MDDVLDVGFRPHHRLLLYFNLRRNGTTGETAKVSGKKLR